MYLEGGRTGSVPYASIGTTEYDGAKTEGIRIASTGNVGIGTAAAGSILEIQGDGGNDKQLRLASGSSSVYWDIGRNFQTGHFEITEDSGDTYFLIDKDNGKVGIGGVTAIDTLHGADYGYTALHVDGGTGRGQLILEGDQLASVILSDNGATADTRVFYMASNEGVFTLKSLNDSGTSGNGLFTMLHAGNVGIGTTSPSTLLHCNSGTTNTVATFQSSDAGAGIILTDSTGSSKFETNAAEFRIGVDDDGAVASSKISFRVDGSTKLTLLDSGNVGIGTTSPSTLLSCETAAEQIADFYSTDAEAYIRIRDNNDSLYVSSDTAVGSFGGNTGSHANNLNISLTSGNVSIGNTTTSYAGFYVQGNSATLPASKIYQQHATGDGLYVETEGDSSSEYALKVTADGGTTNCIYARADGNVGIGTTSPVVELDLHGDLLVTNTAPRFILKESGSAKDVCLKVQTDGRLSILDDNQVNELVTVLQSGNVGIGTATPTTSLDVYNSAGWGGLDLDGTSGGELRFQKAGTTYLDIYSSDNVSTGSIIKARDHLQLASGNGTTAATTLYLKNDGDVGIGTLSPTEKLDVSGNLKVGQSASNGHRIGRKDYSITQTFSTGLTVTLADHTACHVKVFISGDWSAHSSFAYVGEFFIQNTGNVGSYNEPGIILTEHDNVTTDGILSKIVDGTGDSFTIQFRADTSSATSVSSRLCYHVMGDSTTVT